MNELTADETEPFDVAGHRSLWRLQPDLRLGQWWSMHLTLTDRQCDHLRGVRAAQLAAWRAHPFVVDEMFVDEEVVRLMCGMGRAAYLGLDGRVWVSNLGEGMLPKVLDNERDLASCIVRWSGAIGLPELVNALPTMPADGEICDVCKGTREMPEDIIPRASDGFRYYCRRCGGLGWTQRAKQKPKSE